MRQELLFEKVDNVRDFQRELLTKCNEEITSNEIINLEEGFEIMNTYNEDQEKKFIKMVHYLENIYKNSRSYKAKEMKINNIINCSIYIGKYYDKIRKYNLRELSLLSQYSIFGSSIFFEGDLNLFTRNILKEIVNKDSHFAVQCDLLDLFDYKINNDNKTEEEAISFLKDNDLKTIYDYNYEMFQKTWFDYYTKEGISI